MPTWEELEQKAREEYRRLVHRTVKVKRICGYVENDSYDFDCAGTIVKICTTGDNEVTRRMGDDWVDPVYEVEIVEPGIMHEIYGQVPDGVEPRSCWIGGSALNLDGTVEPSDVIED
jgi:hypothetical protein